jgi:hypothetical protein
VITGLVFLITDRFGFYAWLFGLLG